MTDTERVRQFAAECADEFRLLTSDITAPPEAVAQWAAEALLVTRQWTLRSV